jgi:hypothetical protein
MAASRRWSRFHAAAASSVSTHATPDGRRLAGQIHWVPLEGPSVDASHPPDVGAQGGDAIVVDLPVTGVGLFDDHPDAHTTLGRTDGVFGALKWPHRGHGKWNYTICPATTTA